MTTTWTVCLLLGFPEFGWHQPHTGVIPGSICFFEETPGHRTPFTKFRRYVLLLSKPFPFSVLIWPCFQNNFMIIISFGPQKVSWVRQIMILSSLHISRDRSKKQWSSAQGWEEGYLVTTACTSKWHHVWPKANTCYCICVHRPYRAAQQPQGLRTSWPGVTPPGSQTHQPQPNALIWEGTFPGVNGRELFIVGDKI